MHTSISVHIAVQCVSSANIAVHTNISVHIAVQCVSSANIAVHLGTRLAVPPRDSLRHSGRTSVSLLLLLCGMCLPLVA